MLNSREPTFPEAVDHIVWSVLKGLHTCTPGKVESYDATQCKADVLPLVKRVYDDGTEVAFPVIPAVPVVWPRTSNAFLHLPLAAGDGVLLVFSERSLEQILGQSSIGVPVSPGDARVFDLTDAVAIPGFYPFSMGPQGVDSNSLWVVYGNGSVKIDQQGQVSINGTNLTITA